MREILQDINCPSDITINLKCRDGKKNCSQTVNKPRSQKIVDVIKKNSIQLTKGNNIRFPEAHLHITSY